VKHFGVSNFSPSQFELLDNEFPLVTNQVEISLTETKSFYDGTIDQLMLRNLRPMAWSVMGNYFSENSGQNLRIKKVLNELAPKYNATENQLLLAFILKHPARILPVIGTSNAETLVTLANGLRAELSREDWFKLLEASRGTAVE
jgi:predicted oxidoreductase